MSGSVVKSGYVGPIIPRGSHHYDQSTVNHFLHCIRRAADYEIMIDAHEPVRPTGLHRTWPNYLAAESARGTEFESSDAIGNPPEHTTILPFTRIMGGPMDYTPGIFQQDMKYYDENARTAVIDFSKLPLTKGKKYTATIYAYGEDASWDENPQSYKISETIVTSDSKLEIPLARSGGVAIELR